MNQTGTVQAVKAELGRRSPSPGFRGDIEGLRAVAVLGVVAFHADLAGVGGGYVGVDVFFVISGFLITGLLWREVSNSGSIRLRRFYGARARRLLPASATVGIVTAIASVLLLPALQARSALGDGIASALYVSNYWFILHGVDYLSPVMPPSPYEHYWSLGVEEQFYLVWPALILTTAWLIRRLRRRSRSHAIPSRRPLLVILSLVAISSFALSLAVTYVVPAIAFFSLPTRAWELAVGGLIALTVAQWRRLPGTWARAAGWGGLALIVLAYVIFSKDTLFPGAAALLPVLGTALVIGAGCAAPTQGCGRILSISTMQAVGRVSYSWYLWHWPVLLFAPLLVGHPLGLPGRLIAVLTSLGLAFATLLLIENPLRFAAPVRRSPIASLAVGAAATAIAVGVCVALTAAVSDSVGRGAPAASLTITAAPPSMGRSVEAADATVRRGFAAVQEEIAAAAELTSVPSNLEPRIDQAAGQLKDMLADGCMRDGTQGGHPECTFGDLASTTTVALVGDSHAKMWAPAFQQIAEQQRWRLEVFTKAACPLMDVPVTNPVRRLVTRCGEWREEIMARLDATRPKLVVVSMWRGYGTGHGFEPGFTAYDSEWFEGLTRLVRQLRDWGAEVLVLGPIPDPQVSVPVCLSGHLEDARACAQTTTTAANQNGIAAEAAATAAGGGDYADLTDLFCTADRCPVIVGNNLVYFDWTHVSFEYSRNLAPVLEALADRTLAQN